MAAARILFERNAADLQFLTERAEGGDDYRTFLESFTVKELCAAAGVPAADAEYLAETLTTCKPTSILLGWGLHRHKNAHYGVRAIDALAAVSGNIGIAGGGVSQGFEEYGPYDQKCRGDDLNPPRRTLLMPVIGDELLTADKPKIRMIFITAANPVCMAPNSRKVAQAFRSTEFIVYSGHFLDDTADLADIFLPATTFLEEDDVMASYGHNYLGPVNKAIEPVGKSLTDFQMFSKLAQRFPFAGKFCRSEREWLEDICAPVKGLGCSLEELRQGPFRLPEPMVPYPDRIFPTSSGKFQFMPGFDHTDVKQDQPGYPYTLLTVAPHGFICSERTPADHAPLPEVKLHPDEATKHKLQNGDRVRVESAQGTITARLLTDESIRRDCLVAERGGWIKAGHGLNILTTDLASSVGEGTPYYETSVRISPCSEAEEKVLG